MSIFKIRTIYFVTVISMILLLVGCAFQNNNQSTGSNTSAFPRFFRPTPTYTSLDYNSDLKYYMFYSMPKKFFFSLCGTGRGYGKMMIDNNFRDIYVNILNENKIEVYTFEDEFLFSADYYIDKINELSFTITNTNIDVLKNGEEIPFLWEGFFNLEMATNECNLNVGEEWQITEMYSNDSPVISKEFPNQMCGEYSVDYRGRCALGNRVLKESRNKYNNIKISNNYIILDNKPISISELYMYNSDSYSVITDLGVMLFGDEEYGINNRQNLLYTKNEPPVDIYYIYDDNDAILGIITCYTQNGALYFLDLDGYRYKLIS